MYSLNGISLDTLGFIPGKQDGSNLALTGFLDFPSRVGTTEMDWADEHGIEPYVSAGEIFFGGRDINLIGFIKGIDRDDCENKRMQLVALIDSFTTLVPLVSKWGTSNVWVNGVVAGDFLTNQYLRISIPFREPAVNLTGTLPVSGSPEFGIDGYSFKALGGYQISLTGDRWNRPAPKTGSFSVYGKEGYQITKKVAPELTFRLYIKQDTYTLFAAKISALYQLLGSPGLRSLTANNDSIRSFYVKDGFKVTSMYSRPNCFIGIVECKIVQSGTPGTFEDLEDYLGNMITDNAGNPIQVIMSSGTASYSTLTDYLGNIITDNNGNVITVIL